MSKSLLPFSNIFTDIIGFDWNDGNINKNLIKHNVTWKEAEEIFGNQPLILLEDPKHSSSEPRLAAHGHSNNGRLLTIIFTIRNHKIRIISARDQSHNERRQYEQVK